MGWDRRGGMGWRRWDGMGWDLGGQRDLLKIHRDCVSGCHLPGSWLGSGESSVMGGADFRRRVRLGIAHMGERVGDVLMDTPNQGWIQMRGCLRAVQLSGVGFRLRPCPNEPSGTAG